MKKDYKKQYSNEKLQKFKVNIKLEEVVEKDFCLDKFGKNILPTTKNYILKILTKKQNMI